MVAARAHREPAPAAHKTDGIISNLRNSDLASAFVELGHLLRMRALQEKLGLIREKEAEDQIKAKIYAVDAFMDGIEGHLAKNGDDRIINFLVSKKLYEKAMEHIDRIGPERIDEIRRHGFRDYIDHHKRDIKEQLQIADDAKIKEMAKEIETDGEHIPHHVSRDFFKRQTRKYRIESYKFAIMGATAFALGGASFALGMHFEHIDDAFFTAGGIMIGGGSHAMLRAMGQWQRMKLLKRICDERYDGE